MTATPSLAVDSALMKRVRQLDLSQVRNYLIVRKSWSVARADKAIEGYYRFLYLTGTFHKVRPPRDIDEVWHRHILSTEQYQEDCMSLFGRFIHHRPFPIELTTTSDCENDCESRDIARLLENECESDDGEAGDDDGDLDLDDDDLGIDEDDDDDDSRRRSHSFTELSKAVFGEK